MSPVKKEWGEDEITQFKNKCRAVKMANCMTKESRHIHSFRMGLCGTLWGNAKCNNTNLTKKKTHLAYYNFLRLN